MCVWGVKEFMISISVGVRVRMFFLVRNDDGDAVVLGLVLVLVGVAATKDASVCKWVFNVLLFHLQINACSLPYTTLFGEWNSESLSLHLGATRASLRVAGKVPSITDVNIEG